MNRAGESEDRSETQNSMFPPQNEGVHGLKCGGLLTGETGFQIKLTLHWFVTIKKVALFSIDLILSKNLLLSS